MSVKPFFSDSQMAYIREVALSGMQTPITIGRRITTDSVYGDDEEVSWSTVATTKGWIYSQPDTVADLDVGSVVAVTTYRLYVPYGTDIRVGDQVTAGSETFLVSDTTAESTWQAMVTVSLRRRE